MIKRDEISSDWRSGALSPRHLPKSGPAIDGDRRRTLVDGITAKGLHNASL